MDLSSLSTDVRTVLEEYRDGRKHDLEATRKVISDASKKNEKNLARHIDMVTKQLSVSFTDHINGAFANAAKQDAAAQLTATEEHLLRSLKFDRMNERRNQISPSCPDTFTWMLRDGSEADP
ncbi:uncharacterized protein B0I36DRAFT_435460, partial [Microdochium trichocladiopsis]